MYKYKAALGLLITFCGLVCVVLVCSGTSIAHLMGQGSLDSFSQRNVSIKSDKQAEQKGFLIAISHAPSEGLCIDVDQGHFWEQGVKPRVLQSTLIRNFKLYLSARYVPRHLIAITSGLVGEFLMLDTYGNVVGSYSAPFTACLSTVPLPDGCYDALIRDASVSGNEEQHSFRVCIEKPVKRNNS